MDLDQLDAERGGPLSVQLDGETVTLLPATDFSWKLVAYIASNVHRFVYMIWPDDRRITAWKVDLVHRVWLRHNGLPPLDQMHRLFYMVQRYGDGIEYDLRKHLGVSFGELWRERRWREILSYIDRLPSDSHMNQLLVNDEEYLTEVMAREKERSSNPSGPNMSDWSLTNNLLSTLIDAVNRNTETSKVIANPKSRPSVQPTPRPVTAADKVRYRLEKKRHEEMNAILLRDRPTETG